MMIKVTVLYIESLFDPDDLHYYREVAAPSSVYTCSDAPRDQSSRDESKTGSREMTSVRHHVPWSCDQRPFGCRTFDLG